MVEGSVNRKSIMQRVRGSLVGAALPAERVETAGLIEAERSERAETHEPMDEPAGRQC